MATATTKGAIPLTEAELINEIHTRVGDGFTHSQVSTIVKGLKAEVIDCLANGYKVNLSGLLILTPTAKPGRKKGTVVRNPFDGTTRKLRADEPDKFKIKARVSPSVVNKNFPTTRTQTGQELIKQLTVKK